MKVMTLMRTALLASVILATTLATARAEHATNFLDALETAVNNRLATVDENTPRAEERALNAAARVLARNTTTLTADLGLLAQAATALDTAFSTDAEFTAAELAALASFSAEANARVDAVNALAGTNEFPQSVQNQLAKVETLLARGNDESNSVPVRARALAAAFNKIRAAETLARRIYKAPLTLDQTIQLNGRGNSGDVTLESNHTYTIPGDPESEVGSWSYERTSEKTAVITLTPVVGDPRTINLKFSNSSRGTFSGTTATGEPFRGQFTVVSE